MGGVVSDRDMTAQEVAWELGVSERTVWRMCHRDDFPNAYTVGKRAQWRIPRADLDLYKRMNRPRRDANAH